MLAPIFANVERILGSVGFGTTLVTDSKDDKLHVFVAISRSKIASMFIEPLTQESRTIFVSPVDF